MNNPNDFDDYSDSCISFKPSVSYKPSVTIYERFSRQNTGSKY